ncbi:fam-b protein [Plasmodium yoelii]|uniref:Fam-b protein n=3 Tax=Plasmodium yoelii TaxID=5861 RepID=Q7R8Y4_PLAYO|nr:fam-b protein [Plasmodium yoelii]EAA19443.1 hypothetical protein [Plasmodium yoelii yoelii]WBY56217.1 fam-b protein [Plasmodium yoelii yoelii]CDU17124.1 fam-b protein [Plasmodium yoelii]VTZ76187.1 fam-b protein [Plasmodium yoelii]|eukprot:XP_022811738.1 fam-b protein [Plasmodium yoelii]
MRISNLKFVFFSNIICSFECAKNELYLVNERIIYLERNVINFRNNRILSDVDNRFDLNDFYQSTLSLANQLNEYNDDDEEMIYIQSATYSHVNMHNENNTLPDLNNVDNKTTKLIDELRKELEKVKKELDNKRNSEIAIQPIQDKIITKKYENISVSEHEYFNQLENEGNWLEIKYDHFEAEYNKIKSSNNYNEFKITGKLKKHEKSRFKKMTTFVGSLFDIIGSIFILNNTIYTTYSFRN